MTAPFVHRMVHTLGPLDGLNNQRRLGLVFQRRQREKVRAVEQLQQAFFAQRAVRMAALRGTP